MSESPPERRMSPHLSLLVDNKPVAPCRFAIPEMGLSSARAAMKRHTFILTMSRSDLIKFLEPAYGAWIEESRQDDEICGSPQDELALAGYPELARVIETPPLLELVVGSYLLRDLLRTLTWDGSSQIEFWFDDVSRCQADDKVVRISGSCYS
jgi:hypothetical protein